ncbi:hypothetical protein U9M48_021727 [Paspalum notatum var. saurae]|uniref:Uncharacterized protein n=1 Tax=Paspalum notatum var. saurae TaxID=547442 RepID=A0AAQ3WTX5_PASNO
MTPHDGARAPPPRPSSRGHQPSFSAALLDAIYHSLEAEANADADADAEARSSTEAARRTPASSPTGRRNRPAPETSPPPAAGSSVRSPRLQRPPRPCRVRPDPLLPSSSILPLPPLPPAPPREESTGDRADKKRRRGRKAKKKAKVAPFACLLNALLCNRRSAAAERTPRVAIAEPASARSILSSRASRRESAATGGGALTTPARRAVRFSPVAVVVGDERGGGGVIGTTASARLRDAEAGTAARQAKETSVAEEAERKVEELLRALGVPEERERAKESSESSSDLFELDSLPAFQDAEMMSRPRAGGAAGLLARPRPRVQ